MNVESADAGTVFHGLSRNKERVVRIAASLKHSAETSNRRKASPLQSAMSMLNFYINRAGASLPANRKRVLAKAKTELRTQFGR